MIQILVCNILTIYQANPVQSNADINPITNLLLNCHDINFLYNGQVSLLVQCIVTKMKVSALFTDPLFILSFLYSFLYL
jgi:hypothetical protein